LAGILPAKGTTELIASLKRFFAPPVFEDEEKTRQAALLNTLLLASFTVLVLYMVAQALWLPASGGSPWVWLRFPLVISTWVLLRSGFVRFACIFAVSSAWAVQMLVWARSSGSQAHGVAGIIILVLMAGLLIDSRAAYVFAALSMAISLLINFSVAQGLLPQSPPNYSSRTALINQAVWSFLAAIILHLAMSSINQALKRAHDELAERRRVEAALRVSEERFTKIFNASPLPILIGKDGQVLDVNNTFLKLSGYERHEVIGHTTTDLNIYENPEDRFQVTHLLQEQGNIHNLEINLRAKSGECRTNLLSAEIIDLEGQQSVLLVANDISDRKHVEEALRASEKRFASAFHASPISMIMSKDRRFIDVNQNFLSITDHTREEVIGCTVDELGLFVDPETPEKIDRLLAEQRAVHNLEVKLRTRNGELRVVLYSAEIIELEGQASLLGAVIDITERKRLEDQLRLSQKMQAIGQLAGGVAHDFNNILTVIIAFSELLLRETSGPDSQRRKIEIIKDSGVRAAKLTQQLLAFSRQQVMEPQVLSLNVVIKEILEMLERLIGEDIELRAVFAEDLKMVKVDQGQVEQVILNLATNARDAMPLGGKLTIETANVYLDATYAKQYLEVTPGWYSMLAVSDTGTGIDAYTLAHIFEPFFTTKEKDKGTGLGLATVDGIVKQSGGHITVYSEANQGTTVKVYLPHTDGAEEIEAAALPLGEPLAKAETVLLVEDEVSIKEVAREILETQGYVVLEANSEDALAVSQQFEGEIHLLLTDVVMPKMNGRELAERLSNQRLGLKVLYMSGYTDNVIVHHGILKPHIAFLQKPFTSQSLTQKVRAVLDG
jgi:two-component system, cell cycle sensor histidine kinase and response regulator CckA